jgi:hypothetical protein
MRDPLAVSITPKKAIKRQIVCLELKLIPYITRLKIEAKRGDELLRVITTGRGK